jgi:hypothetical protein
MNIFFLDLNPGKAAVCLADKHVVKMILEYTQLLANVFHMEGAKAPPPKTKMGTPYQKAHWDHPCAVWVRQDHKHWQWVKSSAFELCREYEKRFPNSLTGKHACYDALVYMERINLLTWMPHKNWVDPPQCMPDEFKVRGDAIAAYRAYYKIGKKHLHQWTNSNPPEWIVPRKKTMRELAQDLIDQAELTIPHPERFRPEGVSDEDWSKVVHIATEVVNGRME